MAFNPYSRRPAERVPQSRTFTDGPDTFTLTFVRPGQIERCAAIDNANDLIKRYIESGMGWPPIGGEVYKVTPTAVQNAALYAEMQPADVAERYSAEEFVAMQIVLDFDTWMEVSGLATEVIQDRDPSRSGADTATSSASASGTPSDTPN